jgi:hemoglobin/transferrin/lactoferrin receptor protein
LERKNSYADKDVRMEFIKLLLVSGCWFIPVSAVFSEEQGELPEVIFITSERMQASEFDTPYSVVQISAEDIRAYLYRSIPEMLNSSNGVMVQKTSYGQGSPYIRGFTGYRTLFLIDGVRLNNSTFREGPNQYWNTVDAFSVAKLELVKGPSSALYGADAIGGTVQVLSRKLNTNLKTRETDLDYFYRSSTAEHSQLVRASLISEGSTVAYQVGGSYKDFGDLTRGNNIVQANTGYDEYNVDGKVSLNIDEHWTLTSAAFLTKQNDVPRTHKTIFSTSYAGTSVGNELRRDLSHRRILSYLTLTGQQLTENISEAQLTLSWQQQQESRERLRSRDRFDVQGVETDTLGLQLQLSSDLSAFELEYGAEAYFDQVDSYSSTNEIQGPVANDARYAWMGTYLQARLVLSQKWDLLTGARINYMKAASDKISDPKTSEPLSLKESWNDTVFNLMFNYKLNQKQNLYAGIAQGFRAPNLSDLSRFDTARSNEFEIPATNLDSEHYTNLSIGYKYHTGDLMLDYSVYYTLINNQIERIPTGEQNADGEFAISKENIGDGYFAGLELKANYHLTDNWLISAQVAYIEGKVDTFPTSERIKTREYSSRLMPTTAQFELSYASQSLPWWIRLNITAVDKADRLSSRDKLDSERIPPNGTPGYGMTNLRSGYRISDSLNVTFAVENIFDKDYRVHGSGQNEAGVNLILGLSGRL